MSSPVPQQMRTPAIARAEVIDEIPVAAREGGNP